MRKCIRCDAEMIENCDIKVESAVYGIKITDSKGIFANREKPRVAVCPLCGEVSLYIENLNTLNK